jgi:PAS domain S-box-containing protein
MRGADRRLAGLSFEARSLTIARLAGYSSLLCGGAVLIGWVFDIGLLKTALPGLTPMRANTALAFSFAGLALLCQLSSRPTASKRWTAVVFALLVISTALLTLLGIDLHIDRFVVMDPSSLAFRGRMAPNTAAGLVLIGAALAGLQARTTSIRDGALMAAVGALLIGYVGLLGYIFDVEAWYGIMAIHTAVAMVVLSVGLIASRPREGAARVLTQDNAGGTSGRLLLPLVVLVPILFGWLVQEARRSGYLGLESGLALMVTLTTVALAISLQWNAHIQGLFDERRKQSGKRFGLVIEASPVCMVTLDQKGAIVLANTATEKMFGHSRKALIGRPIETLIPRLRQSSEFSGREDFFGDPTPLVVGSKRDLLGIRNDGGEIPIELSLSPMQTYEGAFTVAVIVDLSSQIESERRQVALAELQQQRTADLVRNRLAAIVESSDNAITSQDLDGTIRTWNSGAARLFGYESEEIIGRPMEWFVPAERLEEEADTVARSWRGEHSEKYETSLRRRDGTLVEVAVSASPLIDSDGQLIGLSKIIQDITPRKAEEARRKQLEEALRSNNEELALEKQRADEANRAKSEFLAAMSHEIRTPMNAILGMADVLWESPLQPEQRQYVQVFRRAGHNLLVLINDILDFSKIEAGGLRLELVAFDLSDLLDHTLDLMTPRARAKGLALTLRKEPGVPTSVVGDALRLRQVLVNLLGNAIKFTERGEISVEISAASREQGSLVSFSVRDSGIGIPQNHLERIFDDFTQGDPSTTRKFGGTGLGLTISRRLVALMGGQLTASSEVGHGSTFSFTVLLGPGDPFGSALVGSDQLVTLLLADVESEVAILNSGRELNILVADDYADNRLLVQAFLKGSPCALTFVEDGQRALERFVGTSFDLVLMDVQMPNMDGLEATRRIRAWEGEHRRTRTPIIALTANASAEAIEASLAAGCDAHLLKPISKRGLLSAIEDALKDQAFPAPPVVDQGSEDAFEQILAQYLKVRHQELPDMERALESGEFERLRIIGHNLAGSGTSYGFPRLTELGRLLEQAICSGDLAAVPSHVNEISGFVRSLNVSGV